MSRQGTGYRRAVLIYFDVSGTCVQSSMGNGTSYLMCILAVHPRAARFRGKGTLSGRQRTAILVAVFVPPQSVSPVILLKDSIELDETGKISSIEIWLKTKSSCLTSQLTGAHACTHTHSSHHRDQDAGLSRGEKAPSLFFCFAQILVVKFVVSLQLRRGSR